MSDKDIFYKKIKERASKSDKIIIPEPQKINDDILWIDDEGSSRMPRNRKERRKHKKEMEILYKKLSKMKSKRTRFLSSI